MVFREENVPYHALSRLKFPSVVKKSLHLAINVESCVVNSIRVTWFFYILIFNLKHYDRFIYLHNLFSYLACHQHWYANHLCILNCSVFIRCRTFFFLQTKGFFKLGMYSSTIKT